VLLTHSLPIVAGSSTHVVLHLIGYSCCPSPDWLPVAFQARIEFQSFKDIHVVTLLLLEQKEGLHDIETSAGRFSLDNSVLRPVFIPVLTCRLECSYFGWKLDWNSVLRFSHRSHLYENWLRKLESKKKNREPKGFSHENPKLVLRVLNKFCSLVPLVLLLTWGWCYWLLLFFFSPRAATLLLLLLLLSSYFYYSSSIIILLSLLLLLTLFLTAITLLSLLLFSLYCYYSSHMVLFWKWDVKTGCCCIYENCPIWKLDEFEFFW
jgi:hypothetical protein